RMVQSGDLGFTGTISGSSVTLTFPSGFGSVQNLTGTLSGSHLRLAVPGNNGELVIDDFAAATLRDYDAAVSVLQKQVEQAAAAAQAAREKATEELGASPSRFESLSSRVVDQRAGMSIGDLTRKRVGSRHPARS